MRIIWAALLLASCASASEGPTHELIGKANADGGGSDRISLYQGTTAQCAAMHSEAKRATYTFRARVAAAPLMDGKVIEGCYIVRDAMVLMIFADGDRAVVPMSSFAAAGRGTL